jgi:hypothetical protein
MQIAIDLPWARRTGRPSFETPNIDLANKVDDTKRVVGESADSIGAVAQDLGTQAAALGREAVKVGKEAAKASREAAKKGQLWAAAGGETLRQLRSDAGSTFDDLRSIRIVREKRQGPDWKPGAALLAGASAGIAAMFFLDPEQGRRRRVLFMEQAHRYARAANEWLDSAARDLRNRSEGWAAEARKATDSMRSQERSYDMDDASDVASTPDVADQLSATDWTEPDGQSASSESVRT